MAEKTVPGLRTHAIDPVADFYAALGFDIAFRQTAPYGFLTVRRGGIELNFYASQGFDPNTSTHGCLVLTEDVDALYTQFLAGLSKAFGSVPNAGVPRVGALSDLSHGVRQFLLVDPGGNTLQIAQPISVNQHQRAQSRETFARAIQQGKLFADAQQDLPAAAQVLDRALTIADDDTAEIPTPNQLVELLVLRADVALRQGDKSQAENLLRRASTVDLTGLQQLQNSGALHRPSEVPKV
ncbi:VOC family protein [Pseudonocardiaceae bacterium YIM PH 21723]|nr:VOC family protein [Pseudonocardiaceae bacterium YIM PH 21723]